LIDEEESYYRYLLTSEVSQERAKVHREIVAGYFWEIFQGYGCKDILDVGCGLGSFLEHAGQGVHAIGIDSNRRVVEHCRNAGMNVLHGDAMKLPLEKQGTIDGILCSHVLEHLAEPEKAFREFSRVLKEEGVLVVRVPPFDSSFYDDWTHVRPFTKKTLNRLAAATGYSAVSVYSYHYDLPFRFWRHPFFRVLNRARRLPGIRTIIDILIRASGLPPKELVLIAKKNRDGE
jgi:SAM-dependent methyltransferase